jgi:hypothetical protein
MGLAFLLVICLRLYLQCPSSSRARPISALTRPADLNKRMDQGIYEPSMVHDAAVADAARLEGKDSSEMSAVRKNWRYLI